MEKMENKTHGKAKNTKLKHNGQVYKKPTVLTKKQFFTYEWGADKNKNYTKKEVKRNGKKNIK